VGPAGADDLAGLESQLVPSVWLMTHLTGFPVFKSVRTEEEDSV